MKKILINANKISFKRHSKDIIIANYILPVTSFSSNIDDYEVSIFLEKKQESRLSSSNIRKKEYKDTYQMHNDQILLEEISNLYSSDELQISIDEVKLIKKFVDITIIDDDGYVAYIPYLITNISIDNKKLLRNLRINLILD